MLDRFTTVLELAGLVSIVLGCFLVAAPVGFLAAGVALIVVSVLLASDAPAEGDQ